MKALSVEIWSDVACPWCWVGKRNLEAALVEFPHPVKVTWRAFELDPTAPRAAAQVSAEADAAPDYIGRLARKYGASRAQAQAMIDRMVAVGAAVGIEFRFDRAHPSNTFDAHRLLRWAEGEGRQYALAEALFRAHLYGGRPIGEAAELVEITAGVGLDAERAASILATDTHGREVRDEQARAGELGITGVPFFLFGGRLAAGGAQPPAVLRQALDQAWAATEGSPEGRLEVTASHPPASSEVCGPDGCAIPAAAQPR